MLSVRIKEAGYAEREAVLRDVEFSVGAGELVGLIGPNGAGKSTAIKSLLRVVKHVKGEIEIGEYAYIPERPLFYDRLTLWEHIEFLATTIGTQEADFAKKAESLLDLFKLSDVRFHYPESFSKGMQQKVMLILAFLRQPGLYILDEPFIGLDPRATKDLLNFIQQEKGRGAGILMSTHVLDTAEKICDRFLLIDCGRFIATGTLQDIRETSGLADGSLLDCFDVLTSGRNRND
ncbi:ABC transporter ATP-binding protein [Neobacillus notoginsengisoli]|uniref:ABC transporter ATP-binding protein n=1 Tax=Neobacillus notoginsengisoli TaxID=1578198 RepID=UPI001F02DFFE|nr:ABC transporter ATP-binding protein [Neobacillus notoginsengisoli]